jgi:hypothetical protein
MYIICDQKTCATETMETKSQCWLKENKKPTLGFGLILKWVSPKTQDERRRRRWVGEDGGREREEEEEEEEGREGVERGEREGVGYTLVE